MLLTSVRSTWRDIYEYAIENRNILYVRPYEHVRATDGKKSNNKAPTREPHAIEMLSCKFRVNSARWVASSEQYTVYDRLTGVLDELRTSVNHSRLCSLTCAEATAAGITSGIFRSRSRPPRFRSFTAPIARDGAADSTPACAQIWRTLPEDKYSLMHTA